MEPLSGYLELAEKMYQDKRFAESWNFGPEDQDCQTVENVVNTLLKFMPEHKGVEVLSSPTQVHEANLLKLDCTKAKNVLGWKPKLHLEEALKLSAEWYLAQFEHKNLLEFSYRQIEGYLDR